VTLIVLPLFLSARVVDSWRVVVNDPEAISLVGVRRRRRRDLG